MFRQIGSAVGFAASSVGLPRPPTHRLALLSRDEWRVHLSFSQPAGYVLVENARNERLIGHALLKCLDLNILKVARGKPDVHTAARNFDSSAFVATDFSEPFSKAAIRSDS
jgi:hypothetical protein